MWDDVAANTAAVTTVCRDPAAPFANKQATFVSVNHTVLSQAVAPTRENKVKAGPIPEACMVNEMGTSPPLLVYCNIPCKTCPSNDAVCVTLPVDIPEVTKAARVCETLAAQRQERPDSEIQRVASVPVECKRA